MAIEDADGILLEIPDIMTYSKQATFRKEKIASPSDGLEISILLCGHNTYSGSAGASPTD